MISARTQQSAIISSICINKKVITWMNNILKWPSYIVSILCLHYQLRLELFSVVRRIREKVINVSCVCSLRIVCVWKPDIVSYSPETINSFRFQRMCFECILTISSSSIWLWFGWARSLENVVLRFSFVFLSLNCDVIWRDSVVMYVCF